MAEGEAPHTIRSFAASRPDAKWLTDWAWQLAPGESDERDGLKITRVGGNVCRLINVTFDTVSEESVAAGDTDRRGWKRSILVRAEDLEDDESLADAAARLIRDEHPSALEADSYGPGVIPRWFGEVDAQINEERRDFHVGGGGFTDDEILTLARLLHVYGYGSRSRG